MKFRNILIVGASLMFVSCGGGGGGGGSSVGDYTGTWQVTGRKVISECGTTGDDIISSTVKVNQDKRKIVVDSGQVVMVGEVTDKDGFSVNAPGHYNGCETISGYEFRDASDGEADVAVVIIVRCGRLQCTNGWAGVATRLETRGAIESYSDDIVDSAYEGFTNGGMVSSSDLPLDAELSGITKEILRGN